MEHGSKEVAKAAISVSLTADRAEEALLKSQFAARGIKVCAVDFGGEFISSVTKIIERAVVSASREGIISPDSHREEGAVAGATREAVNSILNKAIGLNVGGKIAIARAGEHISVALFFGIGLLNLNEIAIGLGHRAV